MALASEGCGALAPAKPLAKLGYVMSPLCVDRSQLTAFLLLLEQLSNSVDGYIADSGDVRGAVMAMKLPTLADRAGKRTISQP